MNGIQNFLNDDIKKLVDERTKNLGMEVNHYLNTIILLDSYKNEYQELLKKIDFLYRKIIRYEKKLNINFYKLINVPLNIYRDDI